MPVTAVPNARERKILEFVSQQIKAKGYPPSVREIGEAVGLKSPSSVHTYLKNLEGKGLLKRDPEKNRAIAPLYEDDNRPEDHADPFSLRLPLVGSVAAGTPITAVENIEEHISVPVELTGSGSFFMLKVKGDSMIEAGIFDGDYIVVREQKTADNGEIVVALLEDEATVKRFYKRNGMIELRPENSSMEPIIVRDCSVLGVVRSLMRRL